MCNIDNPINVWPIHTSFECKKLGHIHFLMQVLLPFNVVRFRCIHSDVALVHSVVLRKRNFAILGEWLPGVHYLELKCMVECSSVQIFCPLSGSGKLLGGC